MSLENVDISQDNAQILFENGAMLIFLDVPIGTEFGIDYNSWQVGEKFKGIKMIPPGFHFIYYSAKSREGHSAPRSGFMYFFKQKEIIYKQWDVINETIKEEVANSNDIERFILNKEELDKFLGIYPYNSYKKWLSLTSFVSENIVASINPLSKIVSSATPYISQSSTTESRKNAVSSRQNADSKSIYRYYANQLYSDINEDSRLPIMELMPGYELRFTPIPRLLHPLQSQAGDVTQHCMDRSYTLSKILESYKSKNAEKDLIGEMQLAFICFIVGQVFDAFEQWKRLVDLLCSSPDSMSRHPQLFSDFIFTLHFQIRDIPEDFFIDIVSKDNFLAGTMTKFFENMELSDAPDDVKSKSKRFKSSLEKRFNWTFENEDEEYLPVVVYL